MKCIVVVLAVGVALTALVTGNYMTNQVKHADKDFLVKEAFMLEVFQHIHQDDVFGSKYSSYFNYKPWEHLEHFDHPEIVGKFFQLWQHEPLFDDEIFTVMYERHEPYASGLIKSMYLARDWETFKNIVMWARLHCNKQLFIYSLTAVALFRADLHGIVLPAVYEIYPWHFFDADTIERAKQYKMHGFHNVKKVENINNVVIQSNYSNVYGDVNYDHNLAYFMEDIGLNSFYYYHNLDYQFWSKGPEGLELNKDRRGEYFIYLHWQLLARYYMERLSNDLGSIPMFNMYLPAETGYFSGLHYYNGISFPNRDNRHYFYYEDNFEDIEKVELYSARVLDGIDLKTVILDDLTHFKTKDQRQAVNVLGNILQGNADSMNRGFYGSLDKHYRHILNEGRPYGKYGEVLPNTFMHYETSLRDPLFYSAYKSILKHYWHLMDKFPPYNRNDLHFEGVKIEDVEIDRLTTYFDKFDADISNAVNVDILDESHTDELMKFGRISHEHGESFVIKARINRLNHLPFTFKMEVTSDKAQKAIMKVFVGPKYDENGHKIDLTKNYRNFFELDRFLVDLVEGKNMIKRSSNDFSWYVRDRTTYFDLYQRVMLATKSDDHKFQLDMSEAHCGLPNRLMLPKGKKGGMPFQFFFMVYPFREPAVKQFTGYDPVLSCGVGSGARYADDLPLGFPFDRHVRCKHAFDLDNVKFYDVVIYHKTETEVNAVHN